MSPRWFRLKCTSLALSTAIGAVLLLAQSAWTAPAETYPAKVPQKPVRKSLAKKHRGRPSKKLPKILQEVEMKYVDAGTLIAQFSQINEIAAMNQKKKSSGLIMIKHPNQVRWETIKPDPNLLVSDGKTFWFYTPPFDESERGQVMKRKTSEIQSRLANALLSGSLSIAKDMKIKRMDLSHYRITPKPGTAGTVTQAEIEVDPDKKLIEKVVLTNKGGNRSEISLSEIQLGKSIDEGMFKFSTPPNTDEVTQ